MELTNTKKAHDFTDIINNIENPILLQAAIDLLSDMKQISETKAVLKEIEDRLYDGARSMFIVHCADFEEDHIVHCLERAKRRMKHIEPKEETVENKTECSDEDFEKLKELGFFPTDEEED